MTMGDLKSEKVVVDPVDPAKDGRNLAKEDVGSKAPVMVALLPDDDDDIKTRRADALSQQTTTSPELGKKINLVQ
ncbi:hypothetical protein ABZP36_033846 [Zizania latifolia]